MRSYKWLIAGVLAIVLLRVEHTGVRIDYLEPVETVMINLEDGSVCVETDTGAKGIGNNLEKAIMNLHSSSASIVFLETARYLLVTSETECFTSEMFEVLRPSTLVCRIQGEGEMEEITSYLRIHSPQTKLKDLQAGVQEIQTLYYQEGRGQLVK